MEKKLIYLSDWNLAEERKESLLEAIDKLTEGNAAVATLVIEYGRACESAQAAQISAGADSWAEMMGLAIMAEGRA